MSVNRRLFSFAMTLEYKGSSGISEGIERLDADQFEFYTAGGTTYGRISQGRDPDVGSARLILKRLSLPWEVWIRKRLRWRWIRF